MPYILFYLYFSLYLDIHASIYYFFYSESVAAENFSEENQLEPLHLPMPIYCDRVSIDPRLKLCQ
ncbi:MAG: hypothetical protein KAU29_06490, partial [Gammaproteobacteria bacterium]|nr:hypothetical protein [Gammaproteobacteria bacterium]